ncbi:multifunctional CCA addition/repair protein [soil metagenome]
MKIYLVGGAVRDQLLNLPVNERDWVVVGAKPSDMLDQGYRQVGRDFPVFLHPQTQEEYALARTERKFGSGYIGFSCYAAPDVSLEEDLQRRDLTINAIAQAEDDSLIDPYGGQADLSAKILRHVSPAFVEDPVRILRVARFMARFGPLGFQVAPETVTLMQTMVENGEVNALVAERVWQETWRALLEPQPKQFFNTLRSCGALAVLFPELDKLYGVPANAVTHPEVDTGVHVMLVLQQAALLTHDGAARFAALVHDVGKGLTPQNLWPKHTGHETAGVALVKKLCDRYRIPRSYRDLAILTTRYHGQCHRVTELTAEELLEILEAFDVFRRPKNFELFLLACEADSRGRIGYENAPYPQKDYFQTVYKTAAQVMLQPLLDSGLQGQAIAIELRQQRLKAIIECQLLTQHGSQGIV